MEDNRGNGKEATMATAERGLKTSDWEIKEVARARSH